MENKPLSTGIQKKIDDFVQSAARGTQAPQETHDELAMHMEEKVRAYLSGSEPLNEEDAFLLAHHHFGDPKLVQKLLRKNHAHAGPPGEESELRKRLYVAASASFISAALGAVDQLGWVTYVGPSYTWNMTPLFIAFFFTSHVLLWLLPSSVFFMILLRRQRHTLESSTTIPLSYFRRNLFKSLLAYLAIVVVCRTFGHPAPGIAVPSSFNINILRVMSLIGPLSQAFPAVIWVWWCAQRPYSMRALFAALFGWAFTFTVTFTVTFLFVTGFLLGPLNLSYRLKAQIYGSNCGVVLVIGTTAALIYFLARRRRSVTRIEASAIH